MNKVARINRSLFKWSGFIYRLMRHFFYSFIKRGLLLKAAALSYTAVLCLLPLIAMAFTTSSFIAARMDSAQTDEIIDTVLIRLVPQVQLLEETAFQTNEPESKELTLLTRQQLREQVKEMMGQLGSGAVGLAGLVFFGFLAMALLVSIEQIFNDIWKIKQGRSLLLKFTMYKGILYLVSILLLITIFIASRWQTIAMFRRLPEIPQLTRFLNFIIPFIVLWITLTFIYIVMPNKKIKPGPAVIGAIFGGSLLQLNNLFNALYIYNVAMVRGFYGGLGILPVFLLSLYLSWLFFLAGAQLTNSIEVIREESNF